MSGFGGIIGTVGGAAIGFVIGGPAGALYGAQIGGLLGATFDILTADAQKFQGPRISDRTIQLSAYGVPIPLIYGPENRDAGNVIDSSDLIETEHVEESGGKGGPSTENTTYSYHVHAAVHLSGRPSSRLGRIWCNSKQIFDYSQTSNFTISTNADGFTATPKAGKGAVFSVLRFYKGTSTQAPDPTLESLRGAGNVPGYILGTYIVIDTLQVADFGNALPNIEFELVADDSISVGDVIKDIGTRCGTEIIAGRFTQSLRGFGVKTDGPGSAALVPLGIAYDFDIAEQHGQLRALPRGGALSASIDIGDLGAHEVQAGGVSAGGPSSSSGGPGTNAGGRPEPIRFTHKGSSQLPSRAVVNYIDPGLDYLPNSQPAERIEGAADNNLVYELPVTLTASEARIIADRMLWEAWAARKTAVTAVSDRWIGLNPARLVALPVAGEAIPHKITRALRGANGVIEIEARYEDREVYNSTAVAMEGPTPTGTLRLSGPTTWQAMDMPIGRETDNNDGFYWAATGAEEGWRGSRIHRSSDAGSSYNFMSAVSVRARIGDVASALGTGAARFFDRGNTIRVVLVRATDTLESLSRDRILNGANAFWLGPTTGQGGEVIQFQTATLISAGVYDLTDLLRGRLGTEHAIAGHGADERFVLLNGTIGRSDFGLGDWNNARLYKAVSVLTSIDDATAISFTNTGEGKRPLSVMHPRGRRLATGSPLNYDLTGTFRRRSRILGPGLGKGDPPVGEDSELFEIDILDSPGGTVLRTISVTTTQFFYTAAQQTTDGLTPGDLIDCVIYQMSETRDRGRPKIALI